MHDSSAPGSTRRGVIDEKDLNDTLRQLGMSKVSDADIQKNTNINEAGGVITWMEFIDIVYKQKFQG